MDEKFVIDIIRKLTALLSPKELRQAYLLLGMFVASAMFDVAGIASIVPFMAVLASPEIVQSNRWLNAAYTALGFEEPDRFLFFLGVLVFVTLVVAISFKAVTSWAILHFNAMRNYSVSRRLVAGYLGKSYEWFLNRHSAELGKAALSEVQIVVERGMVPVLRLLSNGTVVVAIVLLLIAVDPVLAFLVGGVFGGIYALLYLIFRRLLSRIGDERVTANAARFKVLSETLGGIKEIKLGRLEHGALRSFDSAAKRFSRLQYIAGALGLMPRFALEIISFGGMLLLVLFLMRREEGLGAMLPVISVYTFAGYRLIPSLQMVYTQVTALRFTGPAIQRLYDDFVAIGPEEESVLPPSKKLVPERMISFDNVTYFYPNAEPPALKELSLEIPVQSTVGIVGKSGSGKTTAVDVILGLLRPKTGCLRVDDVDIVPDNLRSWQSNLGYVPQHIFLSDNSISANIAFGRPRKSIDQEAVERAARAANLHDFIVEELPDGYETIVGERGIRLSGGQRQRIGIARALYNEPQVLVLDEATSALDNVTEEVVMDAVHRLGGKTTLVLIAHRLTTVRDCDHIFFLEHGELVGEGTYDDLIANYPRFRALAGNDKTK